MPFLIAVADEPAPTPGLWERLQRWMGAPSAEFGAVVDAWVERQNRAMDELIAIGEPAVDALLTAIESGSDRVSEQAATTLACINSEAAAPRLLQLLENDLPLHVRVNAARCVGLSRDLAFLGPLTQILEDDSEPVALRASAAESVGRIAESYGGIDDPAVARALLHRLVSEPDLDLRCHALQALLDVEAPYDLGELLPLMDDQRVHALLGGFSIADQVCWNLLARTGKRVETDEGKPPTSSRAIVRAIREWYERESPRLKWDPVRKVWRAD